MRVDHGGVGDVRFIVDLGLLLDEAQVGVEAEACHLCVDVRRSVDQGESAADDELSEALAAVGGADRDPFKLRAPVGLSYTCGPHRLVIDVEQEMGTPLVVSVDVDRLIDSLFPYKDLAPDRLARLKVGEIFTACRTASFKEYDTFIHCVHTTEQGTKWQGGRGSLRWERTCFTRATTSSSSLKKNLNS